VIAVMLSERGTFRSPSVAPLVLCVLLSLTGEARASIMGDLYDLTANICMDESLGYALHSMGYMYDYDVSESFDATGSYTETSFSWHLTTLYQGSPLDLQYSGTRWGDYGSDITWDFTSTGTYAGQWATSGGVVFNWDATKHDYMEWTYGENAELQAGSEYVWVIQTASTPAGGTIGGTLGAKWDPLLGSWNQRIVDRIVGQAVGEGAISYKKTPPGKEGKKGEIHLDATLETTISWPNADDPGTTTDKYDVWSSGPTCWWKTRVKSIHRDGSSRQRATQIPEPSTCTLLGSSLLLAALGAWRLRRRPA
jgi:hypothetical protein